MKKIISFILLGILVVFSACENIPEDQRQIEVSAQIGTRVVLLEDITGWRCVNCPEAAEIANELLEEFPNNLVVVALHPDSNSFTKPLNDTSLNLRSSEALTYFEYFGGTSTTGLPEGIINRMQFDDTYLQDRSLWITYVSQQVATNSDWTLTMSRDTNLEDTTQVALTVAMTADSAVNYNVNLQLLLTESNIIGTQKSTSGEIDDYVHKHVLREALNGTWGESLGKISQGTTTTKTYTIPIVNKYVFKNCAIVAYLYNTDTKEVMQACQLNLGNEE